MTKPLTDAEKNLVTNSAKKIRKAIVERAEKLQGPLTDYDKAVESGDEAALQSASLMLLIMSSSIMDPVVEAVRNYAELSELLKNDDA